jgi:hypothetical protein
MIKFLYNIFANYSTFHLGYWPKAFGVMGSTHEMLQFVSVATLVAICVFFICTTLHVIFAGTNENKPRDYASSKYFLLMSTYTIISALTPFLIVFIAFNIFGIIGYIAAGLIYLVLTMILVFSQFSEDDKLTGTFGLLLYFKTISQELGKYEVKKKEWTNKYKTLLNF